MVFDLELYYKNIKHSSSIILLDFSIIPLLLFNLYAQFIEKNIKKFYNI